MIALAMYDKKAAVFSHLTTARTKDEARRSFGQSAHDENSMLSKFPDDYQLYAIGYFNQESGALEPNANGVLELICTASDFHEAK